MSLSLRILLVIVINSVNRDMTEINLADTTAAADYSSKL